MLKVAITGKPASGKSEVLEVFRKLGASCVSADDIVHQYLLSDPACIEELKKTLGSEIIVDDRIDRKKMACLVFSDPNRRLKVERIIHPRVRSKIMQVSKEADAQGAAVFAAEIPLLYEGGWDVDFDIVIAVEAPDAFCEQRFFGNDFAARAARFWPAEERRKKAHYVIENIGSLEELKKEATTLYSHVISG